MREVFFTVIVCFTSFVVGVSLIVIWKLIFDSIYYSYQQWKLSRPPTSYLCLNCAMEMREVVYHKVAKPCEHRIELEARIRREYAQLKEMGPKNDKSSS